MTNTNAAEAPRFIGVIHTLVHDAPAPARYRRGERVKVCYVLPFDERGERIGFPYIQDDDTLERCGGMQPTFLVDVVHLVSGRPSFVHSDVPPWVFERYEHWYTDPEASKRSDVFLLCPTHALARDVDLVLAANPGMSPRIHVHFPDALSRVARQAALHVVIAALSARLPPGEDWPLRWGLYPDEPLGHVDVHVRPEDTARAFEIARAVVDSAASRPRRHGVSCAR